MALSNFDKKVFTTTKPAVEGRPYVDQWDHVGTNVNYTINFSANTQSSGGWRNNPWYCDIWIGGTKVADKKKVKNNTSGTIGTTEYYMSTISGHAAGTVNIGTLNAGTATIKVSMYDNWNYNGMGTNTWDFSYGAAIIWNDINAWNPAGDTQGGLKFNLTTSDGSSWTDLTNEPDGFNKAVGTTATISNIRSNVTGAHYSGNSVTNSTASSFTWTFNTENYVVSMWTAWDTYTISYNANGGSGAPGNQTKTYGTALTLSSTKPTRGNSTATGYTVTFNGNGGTPSKTSQAATNTTTYSFKNWNTNSGGTGTAYASGASYTANAAATLYAQWNSSTTKGAVTTATASRSNGSSTRKVTFNATTNGGTCSTASLNSTATITYSCTGWWTATSGGTKRAASGGSYTPSASETVYAQWSSTTGTYSQVTLPSATKANGSSSRTVTINANGGSSTITSRTSTATITYSCTGWFTAASGGTKRGAVGAKYTPSAAETLYAQFSSSTGSYSAVTLPTTAQCTRSGYKLLGFATSSSATTAAYSPGASYTPSAAVTLYAVWELEQAQIYTKCVLPSAYQEVDYIATTGTQYINTGVAATNSSADLLFQITSFGADSDWLGLFGARGTAGSVGANAYNIWIDTNGIVPDWIGSRNESKYTNTLNTDIHCLLNQDGSVSVNGTSLAASVTKTACAHPLMIGTFCNGSSTSFVKCSSAKWKRVIIYTNGDKVRDMIPCYRKSDNVIGMYDIVKDVFYTNAGTGTFTKGSNVSSHWVKGPMYVKVGGSWKTAKQVYTKVNGAWVLNK